MSVKDLNCVRVIPNLPATERGYGYHMYVAAATKSAPREFIYTTGKAVVTRSFEDPTLATCFTEHRVDTSAVNCSPSGQWMCSGDIHGEVKVWGRTNHISKKFEGPGGVKKVNDIAWCSSNQKIAVVGVGGNGIYSKVFQYDTGSQVGSVTQHTDNIISVDYRQQRPFRIVAGGEDNCVSFHSGPPFKFTSILKGGTDEGHSRYPNKVRFSPDGSIWISVGSDQKIIVGDGKEGTKIREFPKSDNGHTAAIYSFAFSPDGTEILTCGADKTAKIWNVESGEVVTTFTIAETPTVDDMQMGAVWDKDGIMTVSLSGAINILDRDSPGAPKRVIEGHKAKVNSVASNKQGRFYSADTGGKICSWEGYVATPFAGIGHVKSREPQSVKAIALSHDGATLVSVGNDNKVMFNDALGNKWADGGVQLPKAARAVATGNVSPVVVVLTSSDIIILEGGNITKTVPLKYEPMCVAFSPDDKRLVVGSKDKKVRVYDLSADCAEVACAGAADTSSAYTAAIECLEYSKDGKHLAVSCGGSTFVFDVTSDAKWDQKNVSDWAYHTAKIASVEWSPDNKKVLTLGTDLKLNIWTDLEKFDQTRAEKNLCHHSAVTSATWVNNDEVLTVGQDGVMKVWAIAD